MTASVTLVLNQGLYPGLAPKAIRAVQAPTPHSVHRWEIDLSMSDPRGIFREISGPTTKVQNAKGWEHCRASVGILAYSPTDQLFFVARHFLVTLRYVGATETPLLVMQCSDWFMLKKSPKIRSLPEWVWVMSKGREWLSSNSRSLGYVLDVLESSNFLGKAPVEMYLLVRIDVCMPLSLLRIKLSCRCTCGMLTSGLVNKAYSICYNP
jgi:hypothetical protein